MDDHEIKGKRVYSPQQAKLKAESYCAYQERSQQEVRDKLYIWGVHRSDVEAIIADLITNNFLNEERFALGYTSGKFNIKGWGKLKIKQGLQRKAVSQPLIAIALNSLEEPAYRIALEEMLQKKANLITERSAYKRKHQLLRYAQGKGYESNLILEILNDKDL